MATTMTEEMTDREILFAILESQKKVEEMVAEVLTLAGPLIQNLQTSPVLKMLIG